MTDMNRGGKIHCEGLRNEVELADFYLTETEVTKGLWKAVMGDNPSEWLYATHLGGLADCDSSLTDKAWFEENSGDMTHPVKIKHADALGLYDMLGNVSEWTISGSDPLFFTVGGSYESDKSHCSAAMRDMAHS